MLYVPNRKEILTTFWKYVCLIIIHNSFFFCVPSPVVKSFHGKQYPMIVLRLQIIHAGQHVVFSEQKGDFNHFKFLMTLCLEVAMASATKNRRFKKGL